MNVFIKKIAALGFCVLIILACLELFVRETYDNTLHYHKDSFVIANGGDINTIILGSSHTVNGINPKYFSSNAFNLAIPAKGIKVDYELLSGYIDRLKELQCVILDISYFSFRGLNFANANTDYLYPYYNLYMTPKFDSSFKQKIGVLNTKFVMERIKNFRSEITCDSLGLEINKQHLNNDKDFKSHSINTLSVQTYPWSENVNLNIEYLSKIIELCQERSIRVVAVTIPAYHTFYDNMNNEQYSEILSIMKNMQEKYNIEYYNLMKDHRFDMGDFANSDHLSISGTEKFSKILVDTLQCK